MSEKKDKRRNSFRKLIPGLFSSKVRPKENETADPAILKASLESHRRDNQYENPKSTRNNLNDNSIYENLSVSSEIEIISDAPISFDSSTSTLVDENVSSYNNSAKSHNARPQVPPKPTNDSVLSDNGDNGACYPDVYYHSLEELTDNVTPLDEIEIHKATYRHKSPTAVGAEIKKVSTKFLISPKKEAEVRTNRPKRARSLSLDKENSRQPPQAETEAVNKDKIQKPYTYSAPTSPIAKNHKIPSMPGKTSPYDTVRKALNDAETRRQSLRKSVSPLPPADSSNDATRHSSAILTSMRGSSMETISSQSKVFQPDISDREKTRQNVEAFYWKKLKELKIKEDEILKSTLNKAINASSDEKLRYNENANPLPDSSDIRYKYNVSYVGRSPFVRGAPERATDSMIRPGQSVIVYRRKNGLPDVYPKKHSSLIEDIARLQDQKSKRTSFDDTRRSNSLMNKRVSAPGSTNENSVSLKMPSTPPTPPLRTTSVNSTLLAEGRKLLHTEPYEALCDNPAEQHPPVNHETLHFREDDWQRDGSKPDGGASDGETTRGPSRGRPSRRDDPRRHTLAGNQLYMHHHHPGQFNSHEMEGHRHKQYQGPNHNVPHYAVVNKNNSNRNNLSTILLNSDARLKKPPLPRSCQQNNAMLFDDDPGIMSEVETSSTGFRRGGKQRSSLPVVRTPSKTLERPLGLVFLQYRSETKRALLPNEITSIDTVKALFVRSFPKQLSMQYMDSPLVKIYIHDSSKDMFYELEDVRAHLREIRDRSVLRLFEATDISGGVFPGSVGVGTLAMPPASIACSGPSSWDQDQSYFSEPEIDSEYHHQHVHKSKVKAPAYYMGTAAPSTLPRGGSGTMLRAYSPAAPPVAADRGASMAPLRVYTPAGSERPYSDHYNTFPQVLHEGYMSSPERAGSRVPYEDPYYSQYLGPGPGRSTITPIIDEETSDGAIEDSYQMYGGSLGPRPMPRAPYDRPPPVEEMQRLRVEKMERQLANLTGLVQKALQVPGAAPAPAARHDYHTYTRPVSQDMTSYGSVDRPPKLGKDKFQKSVSFEKSVSFSDDPPDMNSPKQHSPQHSADTKPTKPAIKSSTLPRTSSQERDRLKPAPPPKPVGLVGQQMSMVPVKTYTVNVSSDFLAQLNQLQIQSRDLMLETRNLRRSTLTHAMQMRQMMAEAIIKIGDLAAKASEHNPDLQFTREEEIYRQEILLLENDLYELEATVERLRGQAANRSEETRVNMADIERIAMVLSKSSKTVADWKLKFPMLQEAIRSRLGGDVEKVMRREKLLEEEPERLELALRRCKKLTGTLVTLKRLACVQEQRLPLDGRESPSSSSTFCSTAAPSSEEFASDSNCHVSPHSHKGSDGRVNGGSGGEDVQRPENALDALLDELQTFSSGGGGVGGAATVASADASSAGLRRLHSYASGSDTDASPPVRARGLHMPKPPVPERHPELVALAGSRRAPPPPPPRTTSRSPLASPTTITAATIHHAPTPAPTTEPDSQSILEQRHRDLLKKQKALQEQYARLQMIQRTGPVLTSTTHPDLKKTGSESNLLSKMNLILTTAPLSGSMTHLAGSGEQPARAPLAPAVSNAAGTTTNKVYETDIL